MCLHLCPIYIASLTTASDLNSILHSLNAMRNHSELHTSMVSKFHVNATYI